MQETGLHSHCVSFELFLLSTYRICALGLRFACLKFRPYKGWHVGGLSGGNFLGEGHCCLVKVVGSKPTHSSGEHNLTVLGSAAGHGSLILLY